MLHGPYPQSAGREGGASGCSISEQAGGGKDRRTRSPAWQPTHRGWVRFRRHTATARTAFLARGPLSARGRARNGASERVRVLAGRQASGTVSTGPGPLTHLVQMGWQQSALAAGRVLASSITASTSAVVAFMATRGCRAWGTVGGGRQRRREGGWGWAAWALCRVNLKGVSSCGMVVAGAAAPLLWPNGAAASRARGPHSPLAAQHHQSARRIVSRSN